MADMTTLAERVAEILAEMEGPERGKQVRLAALAQCTRGRVSQWIQEPNASMSYEAAKNIERTLGYSIEWLMTGKGEKKTGAIHGAPKSIALVYVDQDEMALLTHYREATPEGKKYIMRSAELTEKAPQKGKAASNH